MKRLELNFEIPELWLMSFIETKRDKKNRKVFSIPFMTFVGQLNWTFLQILWDLLTIKHTCLWLYTHYIFCLLYFVTYPRCMIAIRWFTCFLPSKVSYETRRWSSNQGPHALLGLIQRPVYVLRDCEFLRLLHYGTPNKRLLYKSLTANSCFCLIFQ